MKTIQQFIEQRGITAIVRTIDKRTDGGGDWSRDARHFSVTLRKGGSQMIVQFSQGSAHTEPPTCVDVLNSLAMDSQNVGGFEDWCHEYGYDTDSRKAEKTFKACQSIAIRLEKFLGSKALFEELLYEVESL